MTVPCAVIDTDRQPLQQPHTALGVETAFLQVDIRTIEVHEAAVYVVVSDVSLLPKRLENEKNRTYSKSYSHRPNTLSVILLTRIGIGLVPSRL